MTKKDALLDSSLLGNDCRHSALFRDTNKTVGLLARLESSHCIKRLADTYSRLLEEPVTPRRTLRLLHAQLAGLMLVFPVNFHPGVRFLFLMWMVLAIWQCRNPK